MMTSLTLSNFYVNNPLRFFSKIVVALQVTYRRRGQINSPFLYCVRLLSIKFLYAEMADRVVIYESYLQLKAEHFDERNGLSLSLYLASLISL